MSPIKSTAMFALFLAATFTAATLHARPSQWDERPLPAYNVEQPSRDAFRPSFQKIDKTWPVMKQYVTAVHNLKPSVSENMAVIALLTSSFVARDIADGSWAGEVKGCILSPAGAGKAAACSSGVMGSAGFISLVVSAPVIAAVMMSGSMGSPRMSF